MKDLKIWVLVGLVVVGLNVFLDNQYQEAVNQCVNAGNDYRMCAEGLR